MKICTHVSVDMDAAGSAWAARKFIPGADKAELVFVPANWDGAEMEKGDYAVDIYAGGKGIKGAKDSNGRTHSCFRTIVERYALREDRQALRHLVAFIDAGDSTGNAFKAMFPNTTTEEQNRLHATSLGIVFAAIKCQYGTNDNLVVERWSEILDGILQMGRDEQKAIAQAREIPVVGGVAIVCNTPSTIRRILFQEFGARMVVFVNKNTVGINRAENEKTRTDHPAIRAVVEAAGEHVSERDGGEPGKWFAHPYGFLFCWGSHKAPAKTASKVKPEDLANAVRKALAEEDAKK